MVRTCVRLEVGGTACQFTGWDGGEGSAPSPTYMSSALEVGLGGWFFGYVGPVVVVVVVVIMVMVIMMVVMVMDELVQGNLDQAGMLDR